MPKKSLKKEPKLFMHSRCCGGHWELVMFEDGTSDLVCERCKKSVGPSVHVHINMSPDTKCECCENKG